MTDNGKDIIALRATMNIKIEEFNTEKFAIASQIALATDFMELFECCSVPTKCEMYHEQVDPKEGLKQCTDVT